MAIVAAAVKRHSVQKAFCFVKLIHRHCHSRGIGKSHAIFAAIARGIHGCSTARSALPISASAIVAAKLPGPSTASGRVEARIRLRTSIDPIGICPPRRREIGACGPAALVSTLRIY